MMSPTDELRAAAARIRDTAGAATFGSWTVNDETYAEYISAADGTAVVSGGRWGDEAPVFNETADAIHIALWDPPTALLVAALLDNSADALTTGSGWVAQERAVNTETWYRHELAIARAILAP